MSQSRGPASISARKCVACLASRRGSRRPRSSQGPKWREMRMASGAEGRGRQQRHDVRRAGVQSVPSGRRNGASQAARGLSRPAPAAEGQARPAPARRARPRKISTRGEPSVAAALEGAGAAPAQRRQHALDVLAGAEPVDAMVDAAAGIGAAGEIADLHVVGCRRCPSGRGRFRTGRMVGLQRLDGQRSRSGRASAVALISSSSLVLQPATWGRSSTLRARAPALRARRGLSIRVMPSSQLVRQGLGMPMTVKLDAANRQRTIRGSALNRMAQALMASRPSSGCRRRPRRTPVCRRARGASPPSGASASQRHQSRQDAHDCPPGRAGFEPPSKT